MLPNITVVRLRKPFGVLAHLYRSMTLPEFARFLLMALFLDERILIYCTSLHGGQMTERSSDDPPVRKGTPSDLTRERERRGAVPWELRCDLYDGVRDFFVHTENGTIGHISWLYHKGDPNRVLELEDRECEVKFCLTFPEFRGRGLYPAALRVIQTYLKAQGYRRCFICVKEENTSSIRGIEKAGFVKVGSTRLRKLFGVQVTKPASTRVLGPGMGDRGRAA